MGALLLILLADVAPAEPFTAADYAWLVLGALVGLVVYAGVCLFWPLTHCRRCDGAGKFRSPSGRNWRTCPRCAGSGRKQRLGAVILHAVFGRG